MDFTSMLLERKKILKVTGNFSGRLKGQTELYVPLTILPIQTHIFFFNLTDNCILQLYVMICVDYLKFIGPKSKHMDFFLLFRET